MAKRGRRRQDHLARKAQAEGFHARSVYKLDELQRRHVLVRPGARVLDLGAAPGSWTQRLLEIVGDTGHVVACDLNPLDISSHPRLTVFQGDFTDIDTIAALEAAGPYDAVLSDAAPSTTGNRTVDTARSEALVENALDLARRMLKNDGSFAVKIFQGGGEQHLRTEMERFFGKVAQAKPAATRKESFEVYLVGVDFAGDNDRGDLDSPG